MRDLGINDLSVAPGQALSDVDAVFDSLDTNGDGVCLLPWHTAEMTSAPGD